MHATELFVRATFYDYLHNLEVKCKYLFINADFPFYAMPIALLVNDAISPLQLVCRTEIVSSA